MEDKEFHVGQIFEETYPQSAADWANANQALLVEISANPYRYKIIANTISEEETKKAKADEIKSMLYAIDMKTIRALRTNDKKYLKLYEEEAKKLRAELNSLV